MTEFFRFRQPRGDFFAFPICLNSFEFAASRFQQSLEFYTDFFASVNSRIFFASFDSLEFVSGSVAPRFQQSPGFYTEIFAPVNPEALHLVFAVRCTACGAVFSRAIDYSTGFPCPASRRDVLFRQVQPAAGSANGGLTTPTTHSRRPAPAAARRARPRRSAGGCSARSRSPRGAHGPASPWGCR